MNLFVAECDRQSGEILNTTLHREVDVTYDPETLEVSKLAIPLMQGVIYFVVPDEKRYYCQIGGMWELNTLPPTWILPTPPELPPIEEVPPEEES
jgi:hypothetical protein